MILFFARVLKSLKNLLAPDSFLLTPLAKLLTPFLCLLTPLHADPPYYLVACAIFQDEAFFLKEWLDYHKLVGVEHFYLFNNLSTDNYKEILKPYIDEGSVDLLEWNVETHNQSEYLTRLQCPAYMQALEMLKDKTVWAAFIDLDEFIVPAKHNDLPSLMKEYEDYAGLAINWQLFGTSGLQNLPPNGLLIENLVMKAHQESPLNQFIKLIVKPETVKTVHDPHYFEFHNGHFAVNSSKKPLENGMRGQNVILDTICINHYWFGTLDWFLNHKIPRREKWGIIFPKEHLDEIIAAYNAIHDEKILRFARRMHWQNKPQGAPFVIGDLMGQLGNQFFIIAAATSLALDNGAVPVFPGLASIGQFNIPINHEKVFNHLNASKPEEDIKFHYLEPHFHFAPIPYHPNMMIRGWFQSEKYFKNHKQEILNLFAPSTEIKSYLRNKYSEILCHPCTVSIHHRSYKTRDPNVAHVYWECSLEYYERAISLFPSDSLFVVFSDHIAWCKENFAQLPYQFYFVEGEKHYHDLYLMSMCRHNIICNSSFSWWGAYLNPNPDKIVVAPGKWFNPDYKPDTQDLIPDDWIVLH